MKNCSNLLTSARKETIFSLVLQSKPQLIDWENFFLSVYQSYIHDQFIFLCNNSWQLNNSIQPLMASEILRNLFQQANGLAFTSTKDHPHNSMLNINQKYQLKKKCQKWLLRFYGSPFPWFPHRRICMIDPPFSGFMIYYFVTFYGNLFKSSLIIDLETNVIMFIKCETQSATYWCNNWEKQGS